MPIINNVGRTELQATTIPGIGMNRTRLLGITLVLAAGVGWSTDLVAQQGDGDAGQDGGGQTTVPQQTPQGPTQDSNFNTGDGLDFGNLIDQLTIDDIPEFENQRNTRFVGRSIEAYEALGILAHPRSNADPAGSIGSGSAGGGRGGVGGRGQNNQRAQVGTSNSIIRKSLRTRVVPKFQVPVSTQQVSSRFQQRILRSPQMVDGTSSVAVRMEGTTAVLSGIVNSASHRDRVERMARLEPGIYRIDNQIQIQQ